MLGLRSGEVNDALQSAKKAGLDTGDIITAVNGQAVRSTADVTSELAKTPAGSVVHVNYSRSAYGTEFPFKVDIGSLQ